MFEVHGPFGFALGLHALCVAYKIEFFLALDPFGFGLGLHCARLASQISLEDSQIEYF